TEGLARNRPERRFFYRRALDRVDRPQLHDRLQAFGDRGLAAADGSQQIEDLLALLEPLGCVLEERDELVDRILHSVELAEGRIASDGAVAEDSSETLIG